MRNGHVHIEFCPICEYEMQYCQCVFSGSAHPDRARRLRIVKDHLELLSPKQVAHLIALEDYWNTSYGNPDDEAEFEKLKVFLSKEEMEDNADLFHDEYKAFAEELTAAILQDIDEKPTIIPASQEAE